VVIEELGGFRINSRLVAWSGNLIFLILAIESAAFLADAFRRVTL
jgi:hypothetical protein